MENIDPYPYQDDVPYEEYENDDGEWTVQEIRCLFGPRELLMKLRRAKIHIPIVEDNLMELYCSFCSRMTRKKDPSVRRVLHLYNLMGEMVETIQQKD